MVNHSMPSPVLRLEQLRVVASTAAFARRTWKKCNSGRPEDHFFLHSRSPGAEMPIEAWIVESMQSIQLYKSFNQFNPASYVLRISSTGLWVTMKRRRTLLQDLHACERCIDIVDCKLDCHGASAICQAAYHEALQLATELSDGVDLQVWWISRVHINCIHARLWSSRLVMPYWSTIPAATMDEPPSTLSWTVALKCNLSMATYGSTWEERER